MRRFTVSLTSAALVRKPARLVSLVALCAFLGCTDVSPTPSVIKEASGASEKSSLPAEIQFFNSLSGELAVELSEAPQPISDKLLNLRASSAATIKFIRFSAGIFEKQTNQFRALTPEELGRIVLPEPQIRLRSYGPKTALHAQ
jgi:hypothetical protein